ncbi:MAG: hypothetical protein ACK5UG_01100 [Synechococcaceae cyanobacterium]
MTPTSVPDPQSSPPGWHAPTQGPSQGPSQGDCIRLTAADQADGALLVDGVYQVIGLNERTDRCWLRRWPIARHGSPVFELSLRQLRSAGLHRTQPATSR